ncbi:MAG: nitroreductase [Actinomycetia bacterium]|nr:nitroreductase [Actinomycetes bacterium]
MNVTEAVKGRRSIRAFKPDPVDDGVLRQILEKSARAPSGGNVQPWRIYVINGDTLRRFLELIEDRPLEPPPYDVYPENLWEPYRSNRFQLGEALYEKLGIPREDKPARLAHMARNFLFFDAPAAIFCFVDKGMGPPQWSDLGMFLQTFMLLAQEAGLDTCAQEAWADRAQAVQEFVGAPDDETLFCGVAIGKADWDKPVNDLVADRMPLDDWATWVK